MTDTNQLHLPDLTIKGFRGIDALSIPRLGRVTLLAGKNSIGKTTVLDAVGVYAARGRYPALSNLLRDREEVFAGADEDGGSTLLLDWRALFYGRDASQSACISIGPENVAEQLVIKPSISSGAQVDMFDPSLEDAHIQALEAEYGGSQEEILTWTIPFDVRPPYRVPRTAGARHIRRSQHRLFEEGEPPPAIEYEFLGPGLVGNNDLARLWDGVALTDDEARAVSALQLVFGSDVERVAVVGDDMVYLGRPGRRAVVRLSGQNRPVPLRSLGDGALRLFGVALALANGRGGFLLIDEAENGIHYSLQRDFWNMVLRTAHENNVQVFATTHSSDCIKGFAQAATEFKDAEGVLVRLSRQYGNLRAVDYPEKELAIAAEQGIEVR